MYQQEAASNPYTPLYGGHYPNQYPAANVAASAAIPYFPLYQGQQAAKPAPSEMQLPDPSEPSVTPQVAARAMQRLVSVELQNAGFERAVQPAAQRLEQEVTTCKLLDAINGVLHRLMSAQLSSSFSREHTSTRILLIAQTLLPRMCYLPVKSSTCSPKNYIK